MGKANKNNTLPEDRGWAWAIAAAGFLVNVIMTASNQTNNVLFVEVLKKFNTTITKGSLMFMCHTFIYSITSVIVTTFILPKYEERRCLIVGGLLSFALSIGASFAQDIGAFIAIISIKGAAHGFMFIPSLSLILVYFNKYRSRASMVPFCGACAASIIAPFIIRAVRKEYGISGTYFLLSAVELNACIAALLLRPASAYRFFPESADELLNKTETESTGEGAEKTKDGAQNVVHSNEKTALQLQDINGTYTDDNKESFLSAEENIDATIDEKILPMILDLTDASKIKSVVIHRERRNTFLGSVLTLDSEIGTALEVMVQDEPDFSEARGLTRWQKLYQDSGLDLWSFRWTLLAALPGTVNIYMTTYLATISNFQGASLDQAALLVTIMSSMDLISRMGIGFMVDKHLIPPSKLLAISQMCMGIGCHLFRFTSSFTTLVPMIIFIGLFLGSRGPIITLLCLEVVGTRRMPQSYSILSLLCSLIGASFNPILGAIVEATGSFVYIMHIIGTSYILCAILLAFIPLFSNLDVKHGRKTKA